MAKANNGTYDCVVIGGGPGGYVAAIRAAQLGLKTAIVDKREVLGGTCLNVGCIPSKALLDSSEFFARIRHDAKEHGITVGEPELDLPAMMKRKDAIVAQLTGGVGSLMKSNKVDTFRGTASLASANSVSVQLHDGGRAELDAKNVVLATGSVSAELPFLPFDGTRVVSSTEALSFDAVPEHLVVIGAGAIGLELGSVWSRLGSQVTVVELMPQILPGFDARAATLLRRELKRQGLTILTDTKIAEADVGKRSVKLKGTDAKDRELELEGDVVLVAVGRRPYTEGLGLDTLGLTMQDRGRVTVDESYRTSVQGVYAIGDIIHGPMLAHKAEDEGIAVAEIIGTGHGEVNYDAIPGVVYTWPELASVGKTQEQLDEAGVDYRSGEFMFRPNGRALAMGATAGSVKILAEERTDRVLGVHIVGPWASDLIAEATVVMEFGGSAEDIARTVHAHPTLTEVVKEAALAVDGRSIHAPRKR